MTHPYFIRRRALLRGLLACGGALSISRATAGTGDMAQMHMHGDAHEHHHAEVPAGIKRSEASYRIPSVTLVRQDGARVAFPQELDSGGPVLLDFIYTSCTTVCPVLSQVFSEVQQQLGKELARTKMVSVSIDPEYDTPARLLAYARKFHALGQWQHYTGTPEASIAMQRAFDVYRGNKMEHQPVTFLRAAASQPWVRYEGFATPDMLVREYRNLVDKLA
jgi:protein SCO1